MSSTARAYGAKAALVLRMGCIGKNGKRASENAFDNGGRKPVLLALGAVTPIPIKTIRPQSHGSRKDRQLYRQMSRLTDLVRTAVSLTGACRR